MAPPMTRVPPAKRRQALSVTEDPKTMKKRNKLGKAIGVTAAECTAVCCCFPCSVVELLVLALYKFPARVCQNTWRWKKTLLMKKNQDLLGSTKRWPTREELEVDVDCVMGKGNQCEADNRDDCCARVEDFENKMWDQFCETGFWRSPSQREIRE
ncbi:Tetratricopeptide repeat (TPR)-like superfamily protein isoform 1 [Hibiscus syriacus]|uniref:Tetratricopeptide repeat (TPR)-like superfamily protein isoform 1 n=1 Tax=Hibiscus syriacus TaxID=106335 RepID=A0A6A3D6B7_HIBSY|nr:uncharacterized protein LOC120210529 [Hibiscus syriacus]KAE8734812.1 Tetratricopeptide repeat (TPR)-like superfamily protein isoform 1 [Hibiscus syriacus]